MKQEEQITIKDLLLGVIKLFKNAKKNWKILLLFALIGGAIGYYIDYSKEKDTDLFYTATNTIYLENAAPQVDMGGLAGMFGGNIQTSTGLFNGGNLNMLVGSWDFLEKVLFKTVYDKGVPKLMVNYYLEKNINPLASKKDSIINGEKPKIKLFIKTNNPKNLTPLEYISAKDVANFASSCLTLEPISGTSFYNLNVKSYDDTLAKVYSEVFLETLKEYYFESNNGKINDRLKNQQKVVDSLRNKLLGNESSLARAKDQNQIIVFEEGRVNQARLERNNQIFNQSYLEQNKVLENLKLQLYQNSPLFRVFNPQKFPLNEPKLKPTSNYLSGIILGIILAIIFVTLRDSIKSILAEK